MTSFDSRLDDLRREESERQGRPDRTLALVLPRSDRLQHQAGIGEKCELVFIDDPRRWSVQNWSAITWGRAAQAECGAVAVSSPAALRSLKKALYSPNSDGTSP